MQKLTQQTFKTEVLGHKGVVLADFYADWCGPCRMLSPLLEEMEKENKDEAVKFVKINVDENQELAGMFGVMSIPTVIIFKDGKAVVENAGFAPKEAFAGAIEKVKSLDLKGGKES